MHQQLKMFIESFRPTPLKENLLCSTFSLRKAFRFDWRSTDNFSAEMPIRNATLRRSAKRKDKNVRSIIGGIWRSFTFFLWISSWLRFTTPMMPSFTGITRPHRTSYASVPRSIRSSLVNTANVRRPTDDRAWKMFPSESMTNLRDRPLWQISPLPM